MQKNILAFLISFKNTFIFSLIVLFLILNLFQKII